MKSWTMALCLLLILGTAAGAAGKTLRVGVKDGPLREQPSPFGKIVVTLHYGDAVEVVEERGAWLRVKSGTRGGWMHATALAAKTSALQAGAGNVKAGASASELTLAGKGFNAQVEAEYRQRNRQLDFAAIDRMEAVRIEPAELQRFAREGGLPAGNEGGQP